MPKLRAAAMNAGVDADGLALGVEFERTLSANSKLLKQVRSSKLTVGLSHSSLRTNRYGVIGAVFKVRGLRAH